MLIVLPIGDLRHPYPWRQLQRNGREYLVLCSSSKVYFLCFACCGVLWHFCRHQFIVLIEAKPPPEANEMSSSVTVSLPFAEFVSYCPVQQQLKSMFTILQFWVCFAVPELRWTIKQSKATAVDRVLVCRLGISYWLQWVVLCITWCWSCENRLKCICNPTCFLNCLEWRLEYAHHSTQHPMLLFSKAVIMLTECLWF